ncbi:MAG: hypothetical protein V5A68_05010 [Candidatus Thermoplasmatota archaeon]
MKKILIYTCIAVLVLNIFFSSNVSSETKDLDVDIHIPNEERQTTKEGKQILVAGIWHQINISMPNQIPRELSLILYKGDSKPSIDNRNKTNYYEWRYDDNAENRWMNITGYDNFSYIKLNKSQKLKNVYSFYIGINEYLPNEPFCKDDWTLEIYENDEKFFSEKIIVEKPTRGLAHSHGDNIYFYVDPYTEMTAGGSDYFTLKNTGNLPFKMSVKYPKFQSIIEFQDFTYYISPHDKANYHLKLHSESWRPQKAKDTQGEAIGRVPEKLIVMDSDAMVVLKSALAVNAPGLHLYVGHSNLEMDENILGSDITFQYKKNLYLNEGEIKNINAYLSGEGTVDLDIWTKDTKNIRILEIRKNDEKINMPIQVVSDIDFEQKFTIKVEAVREGKIGYINYRLDLDNGKTKEFQTKIEVQPPKLNKNPANQEESNIGGNSLTTILVTGALITLFGYMIFTRIRNHGR